MNDTTTDPDASDASAEQTPSRLCGYHPDRAAEGLCDRCGTFVCTECRELGDGERCRECVLRLSPKPPWNPAAIAWTAALLSFLPAGILHTLNEERLGRPVRRRLRIAGYVVAFLAFMATAWLVPNAFGKQVHLLGVAAAFFFYSSQKKRFQAFERAGGKPAPPWLPIGASLGAMVVVLGLFLALVIGHEVHQFDEAIAAHDAGEYEKARALYEPLCDREDGGACNNLGMLVEDGLGGPEDAGRARRLYQRACDYGDPNGCFNIGRFERLGIGGPELRQSARDHLRSACDDGVLEACDELGAMGEG